MSGHLNAATARPDWTGMAIVAATLLVPGLIGWALLSLSDRRKRRRAALARESAPDFGTLTDAERAEWQRIEDWHGVPGHAARMAEWGLGG